MNKKFLATLLITVMMTLTAGCGGMEITGNSEISSETVTKTETSAIQTTTAPPPTEEITSEPETTVSEAVQTETEYFSEETKEIISETVQTEPEEITSEPFQEETEAPEIPDISLHTYEKVSTSEDIQTATQILLENLDTIHRMGGCAVESDYENTVEYNGRSFRKVLDENYSSKADIENFVSAYMTGEARDSFSFLTSGERNIFEEIDGELYVANEGRGCGFNWTNDTEIKDLSESGFTIMADYDDYGAISIAEVYVVNDGGFWKIERFVSPGNG